MSLLDKAFCCWFFFRKLLSYYCQHMIKLIDFAILNTNTGCSISLCCISNFHKIPSKTDLEFSFKSKLETSKFLLVYKLYSICFLLILQNSFSQGFLMLPKTLERVTFEMLAISFWISSLRCSIDSNVWVYTLSLRYLL